MYIIKQTKNASGAYPALQEKSYIPAGYMEFPEEFYSVFYQVDKEYAGFVDLTITDGKITAVEWNEEAYQAYIDNSVDIDALKESKHSEISEACNTNITDGIDVELPSGTEHFSLEETDQINLTAALTMVEQGAPSYPYHADGNLCRLYTADEIKAISASAMSHKLYHTTYCNHIFNWIKRAESIEEVKSIYYGATLPDDLLANMTEILANAQTV